MEPLTIMTAAVGLIGVFYIINNVVKVLVKGKVATATGTETRSDW